jgi:hypothetical protein
MVSMTHKDRFRLATHLLLLFALILAFASTASAEWKEKVLYSFQGGVDAGSVPAGGVVFDKQGNLYVATTGGGPKTCVPFSFECGAVYQLSPPATKGGPWTATLIKMFQGEGSKDASVPTGGLIIDDAGNLYGVTGYGGTGNCVLFALAGCGTVYELSPPKQKGGAWTETILYSFPTAKQGYLPWGNLVFDSAGNLYGATQFGGGYGTTCDPYYQYCGAVFELSPPKTKGGNWTEKVLHGFRGIANGQQLGDGANPNGGLVLDSKGVIYGTTYIGGYNCPHNSGRGCGTVFKLTPPGEKSGPWTEQTMHRFKASTDGANPAAGMTFDAKGDPYGTTDTTVFRMTPPKGGFGPWKQTILYTLNNEAYDPQGALIFDAGGNLYGTTKYGNKFSGAVFRLKPATRSGGDWTFAILYGFTGTSNGAQPAASLVFDTDGNMYSTTQLGGTGSCGSYGCGTVFEVSP